MFRKIYLSPLGAVISILLNIISVIKKPFMVYGFFNKKNNKFYKNTRISSSAILVNKENIDIRNNVWIGHYSVLDGIGGIRIGEGVNVASHTCIYTHSSQNSIRLLGHKFIEVPADQRPGYIVNGVVIGEYTFIGTSSVILPGTNLGKGCIVGAGSVLKGDFPDYSVIVGNPAKIVNDTREVDQKLFKDGLNFDHYYDKTIMTHWNE